MTNGPKKRIAVFGSTGSIGRQALEVIHANPSVFSVEVLTAQTNDELLIRQALQFHPNIVVIGDEKRHSRVKEALAGRPIKVFAGEKALDEVACMDIYDMMLAAIVGFAGLKPTLCAIEHGKAVALANKETLVVAGDIVMKKAMDRQVADYSGGFGAFRYLPVFGRRDAEPDREGYPDGFRRSVPGEKAKLSRQCEAGPCVTASQLEYGREVTIDSATLMNKGLEMIEARWLFGLKPEQVQVVIHPQSIIHSMIQFEDGSIKSQMGLPDMKLPIQYAMSFPQRLASSFPRYDFRKPATLSFEEPDTKTFRNLLLAMEALHKGGTCPVC